MPSVIPTVTVLVEHTDTFDGDANYSWVRRKEITVTGRGDSVSDLRIVRAAKWAVGLSGVRCRRVDLGETIALYLVGSCEVVFITPIF